MNKVDLVVKELPTLFFYLAAFVTVPFAYGVLFDRNVLRAGFLLIGFFGGISALFLLLQAQFLAMAQMMIYAVGITLVVVIAIMLTNPRLEEEKSTSLPEQKLPSIFISTILFITIYLGIRSESWIGATSSSGPITDTDIAVIGYRLLRDYSLPFEFASILLLVALIGAVMLAKQEKRRPQALDSDSREFLSSEERADDVVKV